MTLLARITTRHRLVVVMGLLVLAWSLLSSGGLVARAADDNTDEADTAYAGQSGAVYSLTNSATGNAVAVYDRAADGNLRLNQYVFTDGNGTGAGLGSQGALVREGRWILAVNAGSNSISALRIEPYGLRLTDTIDSGGKLPISVTVHNGLVYVLNVGGDGNISGFRLNGNGQLSKIENSTQPLSGSGVVPPQIGFSPNGKLLVVTEKATNKIDTYQVGENGRATSHKTFNSAGKTPFGFTFDGNNRLIVTEAFGGAVNASATSSYEVSSNGDLKVISASVATHQTAACWVALSKNGEYAYTGNTASDSLSGYRVAQSGVLSLLNANGRTGLVATGAGPEDEAVSRDGHFLYVLDTKVGKVSAFRLETSGQLTPLADFGGLPTSSVGLAAS